MQAHAGAVVAVFVGYRRTPYRRASYVSSVNDDSATTLGNLGHWSPDGGTRRDEVWLQAAAAGRPLKGRS